VAFYGRIFAVSSAVLVPRPESESIIDLLLHIPSVASKDTTIIDIGTGSGCLGITAALELPNATIELTDISPEALAIARQNAVAHHVRAGIGQADLLDRPFDHPYTVVLANLPYVPTDYPVNQAAWQEPALALFAGNDGMDAYRRLWQQLAALPRKPAHVITESLETQHNYIVQLAQMAGYHLHATQGLAQQFSL
jgi:release factor glutamine methyltransferase